MGKISDNVPQTATFRNVCIDPTNATIRIRSRYGRAGFPAGSSSEVVPTSRRQSVVSAKPTMKV
jgi:hypothetical protein